MRSTDWYPDYQLRLYDRRRARWSGRLRPRVGQGRRPGRASARRAPALRLPRSLASPADDGSLHHAGGAADVRGRPARGLVGPGAPSPGGVFSQLRPARRLPRRRARPDRLGDERPLRRPEVREALGTVFSPPHRHRPDLARRTAASPPDRPRTARARPQGGARRAPGGRAVSPRARRAGSGGAGAAQRDRSDRGVEAVARHPRSGQPEIVHAHDPHAVAMAAHALSFGALAAAPPLVASRRVDFHLQPQLVLALEVPPGRRGSSPRPAPFATSSCTTAFPRQPGRRGARRDRRRQGPAAARARRPRRILAAARRAGHRQRRRARRPQGPEAPARRDAAGDARSPRRAPRHLRRRRAAGAAREAGQGAAPREARCGCRVSARTCCRW